MTPQDSRAVEGMARCGISLEGLYEAFPRFDAADIEKIYNEVHSIEPSAEDVSIKMNCS